MQQEVIKELYTAVFQLFGKVLVHIRSFLELNERQLGSQGEAVPGMTLDQCFPYSLFTGDTVVNIGGIKVGEPTLQEGICLLYTSMWPTCRTSATASTAHIQRPNRYPRLNGSVPSCGPCG